MLSLSQFAAIAVGAFYAFAGVLVVRKIALESVMDALLEALSDPSAAKEKARTRALSVGAYLTLASGVALVLLSPLALPLFIANAAWQGGYLFWADRALPPEDDDDRRGRQQTKNAFAVYAFATAFVAWLALVGLLRAWGSSTASDAVIVVVALFVVWASIRFPLSGRAAGNDVVSADAEPLPRRLRLSPTWNASPLCDADTGVPVSVFRLGLPVDLAVKIDEWDDTFQMTYNEEDPASGHFLGEAEHAIYLAEGREIVEALKVAWKGELEVDEAFRAASIEAVARD